MFGKSVVLHTKGKQNKKNLADPVGCAVWVWVWVFPKPSGLESVISASPTPAPATAFS